MEGKGVSSANRMVGVKQYPWMKHDGEHFSREFEYDVQTTSALGKLSLWEKTASANT